MINSLSNPPATIPELLRERAQAQADRRAYVFLEDGERETERLSYGELDARARALAALLQREGAAGERVLLCLPAGLDYVAAFFGCLYAGAVAVPVYPPDPARISRTLPRLQRVIADAQAAFALADRATAEVVQPLLAGQTGLRWLTVEQAARAADAWRATDARPDDLALLMYTSGSTGDPKGVMVSHGNLMHNLAAFSGFAGRPCEGIVSWLPLYHDLGLLLGVLHPLFQGVQATLMPPHTFVQRPIRWLAAIDRYRASASGGPNFAYDLCVRKTSPAERAALDLSCWTLALNGAEPLRPETLDRFTAAFAPHGFVPETHYPSYGMAEATATVTGGRVPRPASVYTLDRRALEQGQAAPGEGEQARLLVGCGQGLDGQFLLIVDPATGAPRPDGAVGEVWLSGPSVGQGYWNRPEETERTFRARPVGGDGHAFLRTGDMGFLHDGELVLTGRLKDLIIIRGVNHYPEDIEQTVERCHPALRPGCGAAFAVEIGGEERLVVVQEATLAAPADAEAAFAEIRYALADAHALDAAAICLIAPGAIPKTSSGKIQRRACREQFLAGAFDGGAVWREPERAAAADTAGPARSATEEWLLDYIARATGVERRQIAADQPFARYGLSSLQAVEMVAAIEERLGRALPQTVVWTYPTAQALARYLAGEGEAVVPTGAAASSNEPVAIIGLGCRLPGARDVRAFWDLLCAGGDAISEIPPDRWDVNALYSPDIKAPGKIATRWGGFLKDLDTLDAAFFGISPREAAHLDPRQRLMLEVAWEALEDAGISFERVEGSRTGVFVATIRDDYERMLYEDVGRIDAYTGTGNAHSTVANRLSYVLGLHGPSLAVDTACSGSLVAIHLACQSLRSGDSELALAGGVSVILQPHPAMFLSRAGALSPDGRCKAFDHRANGYVRSEGAGVVVLKRLSEALADGDPIYAVIQGSAVNQDGHTNGMMAPSGAAQEAVLREAYGRAGVAPASVQYIEAHGTGTFLGDQIEARALGSVVGRGRAPGRACRLGSAKSNVGHTEAAAGVTGLIKAALAIRHRLLPASIHIEQPNPRIPFDELGLAIQRESDGWPAPGEQLVAGVSSFGFGGTNAHVVLVEPPQAARPAPAEPPEGQRYLLPLSARSQGALRDMAFAYSQHLLETDAPPEAICASAATRRSHHPQRLAVVGASRAELAERLAERLAEPPRPPAARPPLVFVFSGQGPRIGGIGPQLMDREPVFRAAIEECDRILSRLVDWSLIEEMRAGAENTRLDAIEIAHPVICAFQIALAALWRSWGIVPDMVLGQSLGEIAAAHVAGALSLEETLRTVVIRSQLMSRTVGQGKMAVVKISQEQAQLMLSAVDDLVTVAGISSPESTVIAGDPATLDRLVASLERRGIFCRVPKGITVASHCPQMEPLVPELLAALADLRPQPPRTPMVSSVTAEPVGDGLLDAAYWGRNMRQPFRLGPALAHLIGQGYTSFLEISPQAALTTIIEENGAHAGVQLNTLASLRRDEDEQGALLASLGQLYSQGFDPDWRALFPLPAHAALPTYPWQRERYWLDQLPGSGAKGAGLRAAGGHPLLGVYRPVAAPSEQHVWEQDLCSDTLHFLAEHTLSGAVLLPGAAFVEMARAAADQAFGPGAYTVGALDFAQALWLHETAARRVQVVVAPTGPDEASFLVFSRPAEAGAAAPWTRHAAGVLRAAAAPVGQAAAIDGLRARLAQRLSAAEHYSAMAGLGIGYGPNFQGVAAIWRRDGEALGELHAPAGVVFELGSYGMHPALLDAAFQVVNAALPADGETLVPAGIAGAQVYAPFEPQMWCHAALRGPAGDRCADLRLFGADGRPIAAIDGLALQPLAGGWQPSQEPVGTWFYRVDWQEAGAPAALPGADRWLILGDDGGVGAALAEQIAGRGGRAVLAPAPADPTDPAAYDRLLEKGLTADCAGIVLLWALDARWQDVDGLDRAQDRGSRAAVLLVQALLRRGGAAPRLWLVTRGAQAVRAGESPDPAQAPLWGVGRVIANEYPSVWGGLIDLAPEDSDAEAAAQLAGALADPAGADQIAFRDARRYAARLARAEWGQTTQPLAFRADSSYLLTGGLGGLGLAVARWMVERGARRLVLAGRTALPPRAEWGEIDPIDPRHGRIAAVRGLEALGASVHLAAVDTADEAGLAAFLDGYRREGWPPIRGVVHAAGVTRDRLLMQQDRATFDAALRPKLRGAWLLHQAFADTPLDFFILFSSVTSLMGTVGQGNYAAGNAFLDALAAYRRARGLPATSINWGAWAGIGAAARADLLEQQAAQNGTLPIEPARGLEALGQIIRLRPAQAMVTPLDWARFGRAFGGLPLFSALALSEAQTASAAAASGGTLAQELAAIADPAERQGRIADYLRRTVAGALRLDQSQLDPQQPLNTLGIDSIMAVELKNAVEGALGAVVPIVEWLKGASVADLAAFVAQQLAGAPAAPEVQEPLLV